jgi:restriction system protein
VAVATVREMWGLLAHHGADGIKIVCVGDYTPDARRFAAGKTIELITGQELVTLVREVQQACPPAQDPIARIEPTVASSLAPTPALPPACPKCSVPMAQRTNRQTGTAFWGCIAYPRCRGTRAVEETLHG